MWLQILEYLIVAYFVALILALIWKIVILDSNHTLVIEDLMPKSLSMTSSIELLSKRNDDEAVGEFNEYRTVMKEMANCHSLALQSSYLKQLWIYNVLRQIYFAHKFRNLAKTKFQSFFNSHATCGVGGCDEQDLAIANR